MKITVTTNEGTVVDVIEDVEEYDLTKPLARADLIGDIARLVEIGRDMERKEVVDKCLAKVGR